MTSRPDASSSAQEKSRRSLTFTDSAVRRRVSPISAARAAKRWAKSSAATRSWGCCCGEVGWFMRSWLGGAWPAAYGILGRSSLDSTTAGRNNTREIREIGLYSPRARLPMGSGGPQDPLEGVTFRLPIVSRTPQRTARYYGPLVLEFSCKRCQTPVPVPTEVETAVAVCPGCGARYRRRGAARVTEGGSPNLTAVKPHGATETASAVPPTPTAEPAPTAPPVDAT